jgi:hypothetical protein
MTVNHAVEIFLKFVGIGWKDFFFTVERDILKEINIGNFPNSMKVLT